MIGPFWGKFVLSDPAAGTWENIKERACFPGKTMPCTKSVCHLCFAAGPGVSSANKKCGSHRHHPDTEDGCLSPDSPCFALGDEY